MSEPGRTWRHSVLELATFPAGLLLGMALFFPLLYAALPVLAGLAYLAWRKKDTVERHIYFNLLGVTLGAFLLTAIAIPKFTMIIRQGNEGRAKGYLGALRSELSIYFVESKGLYPTDLAALAKRPGSSMRFLPKANTPPYHPDSDKVVYGTAPTDSGGWLYDNDLASPTSGTIMIDCTHTDTKGTVWTYY